MKKKKVLTAAQKLARRGGKARAAKLTPEQRSEIARLGGKNRWKNRDRQE